MSYMYLWAYQRSSHVAGQLPEVGKSTLCPDTWEPQGEVDNNTKRIRPPIVQFLRYADIQYEFIQLSNICLYLKSSVPF